MDTITYILCIYILFTDVALLSIYFTKLVVRVNPFPKHIRAFVLISHVKYTKTIHTKYSLIYE